MHGGWNVAARVRWGVLGAADIALKKVIPAMQRGERAQVVALASRDAAKARAACERLGIPKAYGSYDELLADPEVEAIYNPLPNHLHLEWSVRAAQAGKHVLCEKPITLSVAECRALIEARDRTGVQIGEAFMVRTHPQWLRVRELVRIGEIGQLRACTGFFSYSNRDPKNIRNKPEYGGGALMDIGCYPIQTSRFVFGEEPQRVAATIERDPDMGIDRLTSAALEYPSGQCTFTCSTQLVSYQRMQFFGAAGRIEVEIPFNAPPDRPCRIALDTGSGVLGGGIKVEEMPVCDQYTIQGDLFSKCIREGGQPPTPLEDSLANMRVIEAVFQAARSGVWERI